MVWQKQSSGKIIRAWQVSNEDMKLLQGVFPTWCAFDSPPFVTSFYVAKSLQAFSQHQLPYEIFFRWFWFHFWAVVAQKTEQISTSGSLWFSHKMFGGAKIKRNSFKLLTIKLKVETKSYHYLDYIIRITYSNQFSMPNGLP